MMTFREAMEIVKKRLYVAYGPDVVDDVAVPIAAAAGPDWKDEQHEAALAVLIDRKPE